MNTFYIYILASSKNGTLYIGVTRNLIKRVWEHRSKTVDSFSKKYEVANLVYYEQSIDIDSAIQREKQIKHWKRSWKIELIEKTNPHWIDLYNDIIK